MFGRRILPLFVILSVLAPTTPAAAWNLSAYQRPGFNELISVTTDEEQVTGASMFAGMSSDGRYVVFSSHSDEFVPDDTNEQMDIFVRDRLAGTTRRVNVSTEGEQANGSSMQPAISPDGRFVTFLSYATNLVGDPAEDWRYARVYVHDLEAGITERVMNTPEGTSPAGGALGPQLSEDGRYVAFHSSAPDLVPNDTNAATDVFVYDRVSKTTELVSLNPDGTQPASGSFKPRLSADGRTVLFYTRAALVEKDDNGVDDVYIKDLDSGEIQMVSVNNSGTPGNAPSSALGADLTPDGRYAVFQSQASNLVPNDGDSLTDPRQGWDVILRDIEGGRTEKMNVTSGGSDMIKSNGPSISDDGRFVAFYSVAEGEDPNSFTYESDVWIHDRLTRATELVSTTPFNQAAGGQNENPVLNSDGSFVIFQTDGGEFVPGDANGVGDIVGRYRGRDLEILGLKPVKNQPQSYTGTVTVAGYVLAGATDAADVASPAADIVNASVSLRMEQGDLLFSIGVTDIAQANPYVGALTPALIGQQPETGLAPGIVQGFRFDFEGVPYEIRFSSLTTEAGASLRRAALFNCETACTRVVSLDAGYGTGGADLRVSVPGGYFGLEPGEGFSDITAFTATGEAALGVGAVLDEVALGSAVVPEPYVRFGMGAGEAPAEAIGTVAAHMGGFRADLPDAASAAQGFWIQPCFGDSCGAVFTYHP